MNPIYRALLLCCLSLGMSVSGGAETVALVSQGEAKSVIVASADDRFVAEEIQRYIGLLSGGKPQIVSVEQARRNSSGLAWILVGGPEANALVKEAAEKKLVSFEGLKTDGFVLKTLSLEGRHALVVGGNDGASTMYAGYDLIEQYGAVFLLTGDILPAKQPNLQLREFNVRSEPAFSRRGLNTWFGYPNTSIMSAADQQTLVNQMAKMKLNYLQLGWFPYEPWLKYSYHGEQKWMGDVTTKETGYVLWSRDYGSYKTSDMEIGQEHFKQAGVYPRLAPPEFQHIENNEDAFATAQKYMHGFIALAHQRKIQVWLQPDGTSLPPNLARYTTRALEVPFSPFFGTFICPNNPVSWELNEVRLKSLLETYPEVEGYFFYIPEMYPVCDATEKDRAFYRDLRSKYPGEAQRMVGVTHGIDKDNAVDSNSGSVFLLQKLMVARDRIAPQAKIGIAGLARMYLMPNLDPMFPKSVPFTDMESSGVWTPTGVPMEMFGGMGDRERTLSNRIDDDGSMLGMQFNVNLYYKDQVLEGALKYGLAGFASQMSRARGTETNSKYMAEGEWNPHLTPEEFYRDYSKRIFGEKATPAMLKAFDLLEKNEGFLGYRGDNNFVCCGAIPQLSIAYDFYKQPNPFDGPTFAGWRPYINDAHNRVYTYGKSVELLHGALKDLESARADALPGSKDYLAYLTNRTEAYIMHLETLISWDQAYIDLDSAFQARADGLDRQEFVARLDKVLNEFKQTQDGAKAMTEKWSEIVDHPSDLGALYRINVFMVTGTELTFELMQNIDNFHHGRDYVKPVPFEKIFVAWPALAPVK